MSAPADLEGLPWPDGEPGPLRSCAARLRGLAGSFDGAGTRLTGATPPAWSGLAASSYSGTLGQATTAVTHLGGSCDTAATALGHLADVIEHAQHDVRIAARKLHEARAAAARAQRIADDARIEADRAQTAVAFSTTPVLPGDPLSVQADTAERHAISTASTASGLHQDAATVERWATQQAEDAVRRVKTADGNTASALEGTGLAGGPAPGGPASASGAQAVWNFVYDVAIKPLNPWDPSYTPGESATVWGGYVSGIAFGTSEWTSRYASENWMRYEPGYWAREPKWVAPYTRSTPSGGTTQVSGYMRKGSWAPAQEVPDLAERAKWASRAERFGKFGTVAAFATAGVGQFFADQGKGYTTSQETGRIIGQTATVGTASALGGWGGAAGGAALGTLICPGVGTVIGGVVGGIVGGGIAGGLVDHFNDSVVNWTGDAAQNVTDWTKGAAHTVSNTVSDGLDKAGKVLDDITPDIDLTPW